MTKTADPNSRSPTIRPFVGTTPLIVNCSGGYGRVGADPHDELTITESPPSFTAVTRTVAMRHLHP